MARSRHAVHGDWAIPFAVLRWLGTIVLLSFAFGVLVRFAPQERILEIVRDVF